MPPSDHGREQAPRLLFSSFHCYVDPSSGAAQSARDLLPLLAGRGWRCRVFCGPHLDFEGGRSFRDLTSAPAFQSKFGSGLSERPCPGGPVPCSLFDLDQGGIPITVFDSPGTRPFQEPPRPDGYLFLAYFERLLDEFRPDLLLTYGGNWVGQEMILGARRRNLPVVFWVHNCLYESANFFRPMSGVLVPSRYAQDYYERRVGLTFTPLPPPLDWSRLRCADVQGQYVTFVNPQPDKGVYAFSAIAQELHRRRPDIPFLVVEGRGSMIWLRHAGIDLDQLGNVFGMTTTPDPRDFYRLSRVLLVPSLCQETFGRVAAEALLNGIPVLAARRGGLPEVLREAGFLFDVPDRYTPESRAVPAPLEVAPWVETIIRLWDDREFYENERRRCLDAAQAWSPERLGQQYDDFLRSTLKPGPRPPALAEPAPGARPPETEGAGPPPQAAAAPLEPPAVSVLMPVYNGAAFLDRSIRSLREQTFPSWELLAVDDGSTDDSYAILCRHAALDPRIRPFRLERNRGISAARNHALHEARGATIAYLDCDDEFYPNYLEHVHARRDDADVLLFRYDLVEERPGAPGFGGVTTHDPGLTLPSVLAYNPSVPLGVAHRKVLLDQVGGFDESVFREEDWDLWKRFVRAGASFHSLDVKSGCYHIRPDSLARTRQVPESAGTGPVASPGPAVSGDWHQVELFPGSVAPSNGRRLLFCSYHCYLDPSSGAAISANELLKLLAARGWACRVLSGPRLDFEAVASFAQLLNEPAFRNRLGTVKQKSCPGPTDCWFFDLAQGDIPVTVFDAPPALAGDAPGPAEGALFLAHFEQVLEEFRPEVMLTYGSFRLSRECIARARRRGVRVVFWLRNCAYRQADLFHGVNGVLVPSSFSREFYRRSLGIDCTAIPSPIDWSRVRCPEVQGRFATFVNPQPEKGVFVFARIAEEMNRLRPDIPLLVVEGRGKAGWLREAGLDLDRLDNLYGKAHTLDPREFYQVTRMLLVPSLWQETFGRVAVEALVNGIPVLASSRGGLPEVLAEAGFLFDVPEKYAPETRLLPTAEEVRPWVETIIRLWDDAGFYEDERCRCLKAALAYHPDRLGARYEEFFAEIHKRTPARK